MLRLWYCFWHEKNETHEYEVCGVEILYSLFSHTTSCWIETRFLDSALQLFFSKYNVCSGTACEQKIQPKFVKRKSPVEHFSWTYVTLCKKCQVNKLEVVFSTSTKCLIKKIGFSRKHIYPLLLKKQSKPLFIWLMDSTKMDLLQMKPTKLRLNLAPNSARKQQNVSSPADWTPTEIKKLRSSVI